jgi:uncharacterized protein (UPF0332 family)
MISMKKSSFLTRLKKEGKLKISDPSEEICKSYLRKADDCIRSGKVLLENGLYENSISECYYAMYNTLTALLFKAGIKCENHSGSIIILDIIFKRKDLSEAITKAKKERIDKQYYVTSTEVRPSHDNASDMAKAAEEFMLEMKLLMDRMKRSDIEDIRKSAKAFGG